MTLEEKDMYEDIDAMSNEIFADIDAMSAEELIREIAMMESYLASALYRLGSLDDDACIADADCLIEADCVVNIDRIVGDDRFRDVCPAESDSRLSSRYEIEVDPEMKMRREFNAMLFRAIEVEDFEEAARLRDLINDFES